MSAAHPGQGGTGHFNEQPRQYWIDLFAGHGFHHADDLKAQLMQNWSWYPENVSVFRRKQA